MNETTFYYFFSTVAQCLAAIIGLAFVAIQMRIKFLDDFVTDAKRVFINTRHDGQSNLFRETMMASKSAAEIIGKSGDTLCIPITEVRIPRAFNVKHRRRGCASTISSKNHTITFTDLFQPSCWYIEFE